MMKGCDVVLEWVSRCDGGLSLLHRTFLGTLEDLEGRILLLPTERAVQNAKLHVALNGGGFTGSIMTPRKLPFYLYDLLKGSLPVGDLSSREMMISGIMAGMDLGSLVRGGNIRPGMVSFVSRAIGELISWDIAPEKLAGISGTGRSRELAGIYGAYLEMLERRGIIDPDALAGEVAGMLRNSDFQPKILSLYLPGTLPGSTGRLIEKLASRSSSVIVQEHASREVPSFIDIDQPPPRPPFSPSIPLPGERALYRLDIRGSVSSVSGMDPLDEARSVFREIKRSCVEDGTDPSTIALVYPDKRNYDDVVKMAASEFGVPVDQGEDLPLERVPIVSAVMLLFRAGVEHLTRRSVLRPLSSPFLVLRDPDGGRLSGKDLELVTRAASMGPVKRSVQDGWRPPIEAIIRSPNVDSRVREIAGKVIGPLIDLLERIERMSRRKCSVKEHLGAMTSILELLETQENLEDFVTTGERSSGSEPGEGPFQMNRTGYERLLAAMRSVARRSRILSRGSVPFDEVLRSLEMEISKESIRSAPRVPGVQVMGLREAAGLKMGKVFFAGLVEGSFSIGSSSYNILTEGERSRAGLPPDRSKREALEFLSMGVGSTDDPVFCFHRSSDDRPVSVTSLLNGVELSPFAAGDEPGSMIDIYRRIGDLLDPSYSRREDSGKMLSIPDLLALAGTNGNRLRRGIVSFRSRKSSESDEYSGRIVDEDLISMIRDLYGPDHVWSVTQLETFRRCPYLFLVRYLLRIEELEDLEPRVPPEKKGLIFHEVADRFYSEFRSRVTGRNLEEARSVIKRIAIEVMASQPDRGPYWEAMKDQFLGGEGEKGLLDSFLEVEAAYEGPFAVERTELRFGMEEDSGPPVRITLGVDPVSPDGFLLKGSIDRFDVLRAPGGDLDFIWDYKTGKRDVDTESVQVPLYLSALRRLFPEHYPGGGGYYYVRRRGAVEKVPVLGERVWNGEITGHVELQSHLDELSGKVRETVEQCMEMIDSIRSGDLSPDPRCRENHCAFIHMCRRGDR